MDKNEIAREVNAKLNDAINQAFQKYGTQERLQNWQRCAELYRNLFNATIGVMCATLGFEKTRTFLLNVIDVENQAWLKNGRENRVTIADGFHQG